MRMNSGRFLNANLPPDDTFIPMLRKSSDRFCLTVATSNFGVSAEIFTLVCATEQDAATTNTIKWRTKELIVRYIIQMLPDTAPVRKGEELDAAKLAGFLE